METQVTYQRLLLLLPVIILELILFFTSDPLKTAQGMLTVKVFRLSNKMMAMYKESEFSAER